MEEAKARVRYERYVKERAERHAREAVERAEAQRKAKEAEERKRIATEEYNKRKVGWVVASRRPVCELGCMSWLRHASNLLCSQQNVV